MLLPYDTPYTPVESKTDCYIAVGLQNTTYIEDTEEVATSYFYGGLC